MWFTFLSVVSAGSEAYHMECDDNVEVAVTCIWLRMAILNRHCSAEGPGAICI